MSTAEMPVGLRWVVDENVAAIDWAITWRCQAMRGLEFGQAPGYKARLKALKRVAAKLSKAGQDVWARVVWALYGGLRDMAQGVDSDWKAFLEEKAA